MPQKVLFHFFSVLHRTNGNKSSDIFFLNKKPAAYKEVRAFYPYSIDPRAPLPELEGEQDFHIFLDWRDQQLETFSRPLRW